LQGSHLAKLRTLIRAYEDSFRKAHKDEEFTYHHHKLSHVPDQILELGPLKSTWVASFESAHQQLKALCRGSSRRNFSKELEMAHKFQVLQGYTHNGSWGDLFKGDEITEGSLLWKAILPLFGPLLSEGKVCRSLKSPYDQPHLLEAARKSTDWSVERGTHEYIVGDAWPVLLFGCRKKVCCVAVFA